MRRTIARFAILASALAAGSPVFAQAVVQPASLQERVEAKLREAGPGTRFGLVVTTEDGRELVAISADDRFIPASNTKIFTTAAALELLDNLDAPDTAGGALVRLESSGRGGPDVILEGRGDGRLSSAPNCLSNCLAALADAVAARTRLVRNVIGDDRFFPDERWSPGMSWNNIATRSGTAISALTLDDNELAMRVRPGPLGHPPKIEIATYYVVDNRAVTVAEGKTDLSFERVPGSAVVRLTGIIAVGTETELIRLGIDDPAHFAAWRFRTMLQERGVRVAGAIGARHRPYVASKYPDPGAGVSAVAINDAGAIARLTPAPLADDIKLVNKVSQNVHAELLLRRVARQRGTGSIADGVAAIRGMLERAAVPRRAYDLSDGSGMSTYNRASPRGMVTLLRWIAGRPWGGAWRATLPIGGIDGTLAKRFHGTSLQGRIFAKTGTLNATNALSGYMIARSGRTLTFSIYANDVPEDGGATSSMDSALELVAQAN